MECRTAVLVQCMGIYCINFVELKPLLSCLEARIL